MHEQGNYAPADELDSVELAILTLLVTDGPGLWSTEEVARALDDPLQATDALASLYGAGLVHRLDGFVFATRAAAHAVRIA